MVAEGAVYRGGLTDSRRWDEFEFRPDDIVISAPSKCGTTWMQMIVALLVFQTADLPAPLWQLSPWLDVRARTSAAVFDQLRAQRHRRFIKTHTPLDGLPTDAGATFIVVGRDPREVAVSMARQRENLDSARIDELLEQVEGANAFASNITPPTGIRQSVLEWVDDDTDPHHRLTSLRGTVWHLSDAWARRGDPCMYLAHYADFKADLDGQMRALADRLAVTVPQATWSELVDAAGFDRMRSGAARNAPTEGIGLLSDAASFFRGDSKAQWFAILDERERAHFEHRVRELAADADLIRWLSHGDDVAP